MSRTKLVHLDESGDVMGLAEEVGAIDADGSTRRDLVRRGVIAGGGFAAGSALWGMLDPMEAMAAATGKQKGPYSTSKKGVKRTAKKPTANDVKIANYALTLEYLEAAFYAEAVKQNYPDPDIAAAAKVLAEHEAAHVAALKKALGKAAVKQPKLNAAAVGELLKDQATFLANAATIEPVGTAAYAGAGPYVSNIKIVQAALAIHSVEANHAAYTAQLAVQKGINDPATNQPFDPVPNILNPANGFKKTVGIVTDLGIVDGDLQPK